MMYKALLCVTVLIIGLLTVPVLLCLCLIALVWCAADFLLDSLERHRRKHLAA